MDECTKNFIVLLCAVLGGIAFFYGAYCGESHIKEEAIYHGYAQENPATGEWEWITDSEVE